MAKSNRGVLKTYKSYNFVEKDPIIDALRTCFSEAKTTYAAVGRDSGVSVGTLQNWFGGKTRRPQFSTVAAVAISLGKRHISFRGNKAYLSD